MTSLVERWAGAYLPSYGTPSIGLVRAAGCTVWDEDGRAYLDLLAGIAVNALGHGHPAIVEAVTRQVGSFAHTSNLYATNPSISLAERLIALLRPSDGDARVFLCNSGAEANEAALKVVRKHGRAVGGDGKTEVVAAQRSFHGRTSGALSLTGQPAKRAPFEPLTPSVVFVPYGDVGALAAAVGPQTAGVFLEPTLGESGVVPAPRGYLAAARRLAREHGAYLVVDEIQSGIGRTGAWFAHSEELDEADAPDLVTLAKGLGGGLPIGAMLAVGEAARVMVPGDHGSTFGGNPISCSAALAVLDTIDAEGLLAHVTEVGDAWAKALAAVDHPLVKDVRGSGLWRGLVLGEPVAPAVEKAAREAGFLVNAAVPDAVRLAPPLVVTADQLATFTAALPAILTDALKDAAA